MKDLLLRNTVSKKDEKPHTSGPDDTVMQHIKIKVTELLLENTYVARFLIGLMWLLFWLCTTTTPR